MARSTATVLCLSFVLASTVAIGPSTATAQVSTAKQLNQLSRAIDRTPGDATLYVRRAQLHGKQGHLKRARADLSKARQLDPKLASVDLALARIALQTKRLDLAEPAIETFVRRKPRSAEGRRVRAEVYLRRGQYDRAAQEYERFFQLTDNPRVKHYLRRAEALANMGGEHIMEAVALLDAGVEQLGPRRALTVRAIKLASDAGAHDGALRRLAPIIRRAKYKERWLSMRGDILLQAGRPDEAEAAYLETLKALKRRKKLNRNPKLRLVKEHVQQRLHELRGSLARR